MLVTKNELKTMGIIRHVISALGGIFLTLGYVEDEIIQQLMGAATVIAAFVLSLLAPEKNDIEDTP